MRHRARLFKGRDKSTQSAPPCQRKRKATSSSAPPVFTESKFPCRHNGHPIGRQPPEHMVRHLYNMMNARETIAKRRKAGLAGVQLYDGLPPDMAAYFKRWCCPNVRRREDRTSRDFARLADAYVRYDLCHSEAQRERLKLLLILNFSVWRVIGGTLLFARAVGFLTMLRQQTPYVSCSAFEED